MTKAQVLLGSLVLAFAATLSPLTALGADDPGIEQIYSAAHNGHLNEAQSMIEQVLRDHPQSAKAHYVAAEVYAREGQLPRARSELATAEQLAPGLPFAHPDSVNALQAELGLSAAHATTERSSSGGWLWIIFAGGGLLMFLVWLMRRGSQQQYIASAPSTTVMGYPAATPGMGGGIGSGIVGGLATGAALGAGMVAGEALAHRLIDGPDSRPQPTSGFDDDVVQPGDANSNMGGDNFGISDSGSWDDNSSDLGSIDSGGNDDWS